MKYNAFISYSHSQDSTLAPNLEKALEQFAKGTFKRRALSIFRDSNDLSASPNLWGKIKEGLNGSDYFIYLASPAAAQSKWCQKEVDFWKASKSMDNLLIALTDGELLWDEEQGDFDWNKTTAIPKNLSGAFVNEPLYVDFRKNIKTDQLDLKNREFKTNVVLLAATLHGRSVGDMVGEDVKQHKRTLRIRNSAITILSVLLLLASGLAFYAFDQKGLAEEQTKLAEEQTKRAEEQRKRAEYETLRLKASNFLSNAQALSTDKTEAINVAVQGYRFADSLGLDTERIATTLLKLLHEPNGMYLQELKPNLQTTEITYNREIRAMNSKTLSVEDDKGWNYILLSGTDGEQQIMRDGNFGDSINYLTFSPKGRFVIARDGALPAKDFDGRGEFSSTVAVFSLSGKVLGMSSFYYGMGGEEAAQNYKVLFNENETLVLSLEGVKVEGRRAVLRDIESGEIIFSSDKKEYVNTIAMDSTGKLIVYGTNKGVIKFIRFADYGTQLSWTVESHAGEQIDDLRFTVDSKYLISESDSYTRQWPINGYNRGILSPQLEQVEPVNEIQNLKDGVLTQYGYLFNEEEPFYFEYKALNNQVSRFDTIHDFMNQANFLKLKSPNSKFRFKEKGIYSSNTLIAPLNIDFVEQQHRMYSHLSFSNDNKYMLIFDSRAEYRGDEPVRLYILDPNIIVDRLIAQPELFGEVLKVNNESR